MEEVPKQERRQWPRHDIDVAIKVRIASAGGLTAYAYGRGDNLSEGGIAAHLQHHLELGATVRLSMVLPHASRQIDCQAVVRNKNEFAYGLQFKDLTTADLELIRNTCTLLGGTPTG